jgi:hypothetical protein
MNDSIKADEARDDFILQERLSGRSARSISKELCCTVADVDASLDRTLPKIDNAAKLRIIALDLDRLDELLKVFLKRAIEKQDCQAGLLVVKILERKAAILGTDAAQKLDIVQVQAQKEPSQHDKIKDAIMRVARGPNWRELVDPVTLEDLPPKGNGNGASSEQFATPSDRERDTDAT